MILMVFPWFWWFSDGLPMIFSPPRFPFF
jgi:hypothetical protein